MDVNLDGNTITNAYLSGIEGTGTVNLADATVTLPPDSVTISNIDATGTPSSTTYLRGDGTWSNPTSGGAPVTLTGDAVGTGTGTVPVTVEGINGTSLAGLASGVLYSTTATGVPSIATANELASGLTGTTGTVNLSGATVTLPADSVTVSNIDATGTPSSTSYLRGDGTWSAAGSGPVTLTGDAVGSGTGSVPVTVERINGTSLAGLATGLLKNTTATGVPSIAAAGTDYLSPAAIGTTVQAYNANTTTQGNTFNGASQLLQADGSGYIVDSAIRPGGKLIYVSVAQGNDTRTGLSKYSYQHPFATYGGAKGAAASGDTIVLTDGTYTSVNNILSTGINIIIMPGANFAITGASAGNSIFTDNSTIATGVTITGYGQTLSIAGSNTGILSGLLASTPSSITVNNLNLTVTNASYGAAYGINNGAGGTINWTGNSISVSGQPGTSAINNVGSFAVGIVSFSGNAVSTTGVGIVNHGSFGGAGTVTVGSFSDASGYSSYGTGLTITSPQTVVQTLASPSTGFTQAFNYGPQDQDMVITPSTTLATGTVTFPVDANTRIGQKLWICNASTHTITSLTVSVSGGTIYGYTTGPLPSGSIMFQKTASNVWEQISPPSLDSINTTTVTGTSQTASTNQIYISNNASRVTVTVPSTANVGDTVEIDGLGAGGWLLAQNASQVVHMSSASTTTGTGGSIASTNQYNTIKVRCIVASTTWIVIQSEGTLTVT